MKSRLAYWGYPSYLQYALIALAGFSFWFVLGFPFANHNESYSWIVLFDKYGLFDILKGNTRPLGFATAWLGYRFSGGSIYPQQILNYFGAVLAWLILFSAVKEKKLFSWVSLIVGGGFFSGYIYLFHLHGVSYSPILMFLAFLLARAIQNKSINGKLLLVISALALVTSLYHPFAIPIYIAYMAGYVLEHRHAITHTQLLAASLLMLVAFGLIKVLIPSQDLLVTINMIKGLFVSYDLVEINSFVSIASWLLSLLTVVSLNTSRFAKVTLGSVITALSVVFAWLNWPVVIVWIFVSLLKMALMRRWTIGLLIMGTAILPVATGTGSPAYTIFAIMTCSCALPLGWSFFEKDSVIYDKLALVPLTIVVLVGTLTKAGVQLPVLSGLVNPVLAEKEKTYQMEEAIRWITSSKYKDYRPVLCQPAGSPSVTTNAVERTFRAPTGQGYLDKYVSSLGIGSRPEGTRQLFVCFGGETIENAKIVYAIAGKYNGDAFVWIQTKAVFLNHNANQQVLQGDIRHKQHADLQEHQTKAPRHRYAQENCLQN